MPARSQAAAARVVLVTGVSRFLGLRLAKKLQADPRIERIIAVDTVAPGSGLGRTEFVHVDLRSSGIEDVIGAAGVDTVVHLDFVTGGAAGRAKEIDVTGTMQLLSACQRCPSVRKLVVRSTSSVYGASPRDPAMYGETDDPTGASFSSYGRDAMELEGYVRGLSRRRSDITVSVLRFANFVGPGVDSPLTRYFSLPVVPTILGYDPRLQFIHEDDGVAMLRRMALEDHPGTYNAAGEGVLHLSQALRRARRPAVAIPQPAFDAFGTLGRRTGVVGFSGELVRQLKYGRVLDTRRLVSELSWSPAYSSEEAFADFTWLRGLRQNASVQVFERLGSGIGGKL